MLGYETAVKGTGVFAFLQLGPADTPTPDSNDCGCKPSDDKK